MINLETVIAHPNSFVDIVSVRLITRDKSLIIPENCFRNLRSVTLIFFEDFDHFKMVPTLEELKISLDLLSPRENLDFSMLTNLRQFRISFTSKEYDIFSLMRGLPKGLTDLSVAGGFVTHRENPLDNYHDHPAYCDARASLDLLCEFENLEILCFWPLKILDAPVSL
jgi:hypothetical protein